MYMKKSLMISVVFILVLGCLPQKAITYENKYLEYLSYIEDASIKDIPEFFNRSEAILMIEDISGIESFTHYGYSDWKVPNKWNFRDWRDWYFINKNNIYFDKDLNKFRSEGVLIALNKNPIGVYNEYLNIILNNNINHRQINGDHLDYAMHFFSELTKREFNKTDTFRIPNDEDISFLNDWLIKNEQNILWDIQSQKIILN